MVAENEAFERRKRWRLALGADAEDTAELQKQLSTEEQTIDQLLDQLYGENRQGGQRRSKPLSSKWFGSVKEFFPKSVIHLLQRDAIDRFGIKKLLSQTAILDEVEPDVSLIADVLSVKDALKGQSLDDAKQLIRKLARAVEEKLRFKLVNRLGRLRHPGQRIINPRQADIDWHLTIRANLQHYQPELGTIIPEKLLGRPRHSKAVKQLILLVDQSASMTQSVIYAGILAGIMTAIKSIETRFVVFDTSVVDLTAYLQDAVEMLFQVQLGGGTDIQQAVKYAADQINPSVESQVVLISDLYEGAPEELLVEACQNLINLSVPMIVLLALDDQGTPAYDKQMAARLNQLNIPCFACSPDKFPEVMAAALNHEDLGRFT